MRLVPLVACWLVGSCCAEGDAAGSSTDPAVETYAYPWQNPSLSTAARTDNLISLLTVAEKASLLNAGAPAIPRISLPPYSWGRECERGDASGKLGTAYPTGLALAASFDPALVQDVAEQTAIEVHASSA